MRAGEGLYGARDTALSFRIGRSQISTVDLAKKRMTVVRDGRKIAAYPVTGGNADHPTWSGVMVISERLKQTRMESSTVGLGHEYDIPDVPHAQRLTTSGTFIHGNYWTRSGVFGHDNTTHGCIGLHDAKDADDEATAGHAFFTGSRIGDLVIVKNSGSGPSTRPTGSTAGTCRGRSGRRAALCSPRAASVGELTGAVRTFWVSPLDGRRAGEHIGRTLRALSGTPGDARGARAPHPHPRGTPT